MANEEAAVLRDAEVDVLRRCVHLVAAEEQPVVRLLCRRLQLRERRANAIDWLHGVGGVEEDPRPPGELKALLGRHCAKRGARLIGSYLPSLGTLRRNRDRDQGKQGNEQGTSKHHDFPPLPRRSLTHECRYDIPSALETQSASTNIY